MHQEGILHHFFGIKGFSTCIYKNKIINNMQFLLICKSQESKKIKFQSGRIQADAVKISIPATQALTAKRNRAGSHRN